MKKILVIFFILITVSGCAKKVPLQLNKEIENSGVVVIQNGVVINENQMVQKSATQEKIVSLPFEMTINENSKLTITNNGMIIFDDNVFIYNENSNETVRENDIMLKITSKNNLLGIYITEQYYSGGTIEYTFVYNVNANELLINQRSHMNEQGQWSSFWDFFSMGNKFLVVLSDKAYAYNDTTGELLWTQTFCLRRSRRVIIYNDRFLIDDEDGNRYSIYSDGRKEKL